MRAFLERLRPFAPISLRVALAVLCCLYGYRLLLRELAAFQGQVTAWGFPKWVGNATAWGFLGGGAMLGLGLATRLAAFVIAVAVIFLTVQTKLHSGYWGGLDLPSFTVAACLSLLLSGAGRFSLDRRFFGGP